MNGRQRRRAQVYGRRRTVNSPRTCTRTVTETLEAETTRIIGKAYRLGGASSMLP
jgi:hypothetical protein